MSNKDLSKKELLFAAIADDDTGASDLAGMLADRGVRTLLIIDENPELVNYNIDDFQAIVLGIRTRSLPSHEANRKTKVAVKLLKKLTPAMLFFKYCSTFDSTEKGNIGNTIETIFAETGENFTVCVPALPINGRTVYQGHLFVYEQLLSDSPLKDHPLNPMNESNLVEFLQRQMSGKVGLANRQKVEKGAVDLGNKLKQLQSNGNAAVVIDCVNEKDLQTIAESVSDFGFITGSSALGSALPEVWQKRGLLVSFQNIAKSPISKNGVLILSGSCSPATHEQNKQFNGEKIQIDSLQLLKNQIDTKLIVERTIEILSAGGNCLIAISSMVKEIKETQAWGKENSFSETKIGEMLLEEFCKIAIEIFKKTIPRGLILSGGETSGKVAKMLQLGAFEVGPNIVPGVPVCYSLGEYQLPVVLKSGNFGNEDFYQKAIETIG